MTLDEERTSFRALALLHDRVVEDFIRDPALPPAPDLSAVDPALLAEAPERLLGLAPDLLVSGGIDRGKESAPLSRPRPS